MSDDFCTVEREGQGVLEFMNDAGDKLGSRCISDLLAFQNWRVKMTGRIET
jgi:hypothetical protein